MRRTIAAGLAAAALTLTTACNSAPQTVAAGSPAPTTTTAPTPTTPDDAVDPKVLTGAAVKAMSGPVRMVVSVTAGPATIDMSGDFDALLNKLVLTMKTTEGDMELRRTGSDMYLRTAETEGKWIHIDVRKLNKSGPMAEALNPLANLGALGGVTSAREVSPGRYEGLVDMAKAAANGNPLSEKIATDQLQKYANVPKDMPFDATVDDQGRLTTFNFSMKIPTGEVRAEMELSRFGEKIVITKPPAAQTVEAPASAYKDF